MTARLSLGSPSRPLSYGQLDGTPTGDAPRFVSAVVHDDLQVRSHASPAHRAIAPSTSHVWAPTLARNYRVVSDPGHVATAVDATTLDVSSASLSLGFPSRPITAHTVAFRGASRVSTAIGEQFGQLDAISWGNMPRLTSAVVNDDL